MRIRPYIPGKDYEYVSKWVDDERTHAFWCANRLPYPITQQSFHDFLEKMYNHTHDHLSFLPLTSVFRLDTLLYPNKMHNFHFRC